MPLSIGIASSARVSFWIGAGQPVKARRAVWIGFRLAALSAFALSAILFIANEGLASLYSRNPAVVGLGSGLLLWVAFYHLADAVQAVCAFLLRCYRITLLPLVLYSVLLWGLGLLGGYTLAYRGWSARAATESATSFWVASTFAIAMVALCFCGLLWHAVRRSVPRTEAAEPA